MAKDAKGMYHKIRIEGTEPGFCKVYLDDKPIQANHISYEHGIDCLGTLTIYGGYDTLIEEEGIVVDYRIIADEVKRSLEPYVEENVKLNREIDRLKWKIRANEDFIYRIQTENSRLKDTHEDSGLTRDVPQMRLWNVRELTNGQKMTNWFCPKCYKQVSNWEPYCCICGQRLQDKGEHYAPELEVEVTEDGEIKRKVERE